MKESVNQVKSYAFALRIIRLFQWLTENRKEFVLSKQLLRCGTSIGANIEEATGAYSEKEFAAKMQIAFKEALETRYWLRLLYDSNVIDEMEFQSLITDCEELIRLLSTTTKTLREKLNDFSVREALEMYSTPPSSLLSPTFTL